MSSNVPDGWVVDKPKATYAEVTLGGPEQAFSPLDAAEVRVSLEIANAHEDATARLPTEPNLRNVPNELRVNQIVPREVDASVHRSSNEPAHSNELWHGVCIADIACPPTFV